MKLLFAVIAIVATAGAPAQAVLVTLDNGTENTINSATGDRYRVLDSATMDITTIVVESPAMIFGGGANLEVAVELLDNSVANINGGEISGGTGSFASGILANQSSVINLNGGTITAGTGFAAFAVAVQSTSTLNMSGGTLQGASSVFMSESAVLNFTGGTIAGTLQYTGVSTANFFGWDFFLNGNPIDPGSYAGTTGTLAFTDGNGVAQSISLSTSAFDAPTLTLVAIPEPASFSLLCGASLGLVTLRRRQR